MSYKIDWTTLKVDLYNGEATNGSFSLSNSPRNYDYIIIHWRTIFNGTQYGTTLLSGEVTTFSLVAMQCDWTGTSKYTNIANYTLTSTGLALGNCSNYSGANANAIYITKVVGIKMS